MLPAPTTTAPPEPPCPLPASWSSEAVSSGYALPIRWLDAECKSPSSNAHSSARAPSRGNAGIVAAGHPPLNRPGKVRQSLPHLFDPRSPLYVSARLDIGVWRWLAEFARHCTHRPERHCLQTLAPLGLDTLACFDAMVGEEGIACDYRRGSYLEVCVGKRLCEGA